MLYYQNIKVASYHKLQKFVADTAGRMHLDIGRTIILPSTFQGSPRNMRQRYHDAMAIVSKHGTPDLFTTFTCNPNWREIRENLYPGQTAADRADLLARVFRIKLKALKHEIMVLAHLGK